MAGEGPSAPGPVPGPGGRGERLPCRRKGDRWGAGAAGIGPRRQADGTRTTTKGPQGSGPARPDPARPNPLDERDLVPPGTRRLRGGRGRRRILGLAGSRPGGHHGPAPLGAGGRNPRGRGR